MKRPTLPNFFHTKVKTDPIRDNLINYHENLHKNFRWTKGNSLKIVGFVASIFFAHEWMIASMRDRNKPNTSNDPTWFKYVRESKRDY
eukprot:gene11235-4055_t